MARTVRKHDSQTPTPDAAPPSAGPAEGSALKVVDRPTPNRRPTPAEVPDTDAPPSDAPPDSEASSEAADGPKRSGPARKILLIAIIGALLVGGGLYGRHWWTVGRFIESTEDAYVQSDIVSISVQVAGEVAEAPFEDNTRVEAGDVILRLDGSPYDAALASAKADVEVAQAAIDNTAELETLQVTKVAAARADVEDAQSQLDLARVTDERASSLAQRGVSTQADADSAAAALDAARAAFSKAQAALSVEKGQFPILASQRRSQEAALRRAEAAQSIAALDVEHSVIRAPRAGIVGNIGVRPGEYVSPGVRVMSLVPTQDSYITANFKETQIGGFEEGMPVEIEVDMLGGRVLEGAIVSLAPASGSEFSVLPPDNATGNFTKIVQRVPVRIRLSDLDGAPVLRSGTSVVVSVNTKAGAQGDAAGAEVAAQ